MKKKPFIITIDTESDNQWEKGKCQSTENARYIPRFQKLCEKYNLKPVYLVDYSMSQNDSLIEYLKDCIDRGTCEVGMHLHAWDTPPIHKLDRCEKARPYLIEYPKQVMIDKIKSMHDCLNDKFQTEMISHRAGRWAIDRQYVDVLVELGYKVDCSVTPGVDWTKVQGATRGGVDYSKCEHLPFWLDKQHRLLEVPTTVHKVHVYNSSVECKSMIKEVIKYIIGRNAWLRPALCDNETMIKLLLKTNIEYAEFMMHSSELMPGGSPYFPDFQSIEVMYEKLEKLFEFIINDFEGVTLKEYYDWYSANN